MNAIKTIHIVLSAILVLSASRVALAEEHHEQPQGQGSFSFALIGDTPYHVAPGEPYPALDNVINEINADHHIKWVMHAGDIKNGSTPCSDAMYLDRLARYNHFDKPVVLTPGDNEWTDCHRVKAGEYQPLERLARLREIFFAEPGRTIGAEPMRVQSQAFVPGFEEFPENVMWREQNIMFATLHVVGSENGLLAFDPASSAVRTAADDAEVARRIDAALHWLDTAFAQAREHNSPGIFLMIHADPRLERAEENRNGFVEFLAALEQHVQAFGKPVVLAHGDSHYFRIDKPALVKKNFLPNLTRVETFGPSQVHWVKISVDPKSRDVFVIRPQIVAANR